MRFSPRAAIARRATVLALGLAFGLASSPTAPVLAQDSGGGLQYRFGMSQDIRARSNPRLSTPSSSTELQALTNLSFGFLTETRTDRLAIDAAGSLQILRGQRARLLSDPSISASYQRENASTRLSLTGSLRQRRVDTLDFVFDEDEFGLPFLIVTDTRASQWRSAARLRVDFGRDAPFGGTFTVGQSDTRYSGTTNPELVDNLRRDAALNLRFDLSPVLTLRPGVSIARFQEKGAASRQTESFSLGLDLKRPDGTYTLDLRQSRAPASTRTTLMAGRSFELPRGALDIQIGATKLGSGGRVGIIGSVDWREEMPDGTLSLGLSRSIGGDARDRETERTQFNAAVSQRINPTLSGQARLSVQQSTLVGGGASVRNAELSASLRYNVTEDWGLSAGASYRSRKPSGASSTNSTTVFLNFDRDFLARR